MKPNNLTPSLLIKSFILALILLLAGQGSHLPANAAGGEDDSLLVSSFGGGFGPDGRGSVTVALNTQFFDLAIQPDGKVVIAGRSAGDIMLARYKEDGSPDRSWNPNGLVRTDLGGVESAIAVTVQPDGKIVIGGEKDDDLLVARFKPDGSLDRDFDFTGFNAIDFDGGRDFAVDVAVQLDGKLVLGGRTDDCGITGCGRYHFGLARFNSSGGPDRSFDQDGKVVLDFGGIFGEIVGSLTALKLHNNTIVAVGRSDEKTAVARLSQRDGQPDSTFDGDGKLTSSVMANVVFDGVVQPDGKIVVVGGTDPPRVARFKAGGGLDSTFGDKGIINPIGQPAGTDRVQAVLLRPNGTILIAGTAGDPKNVLFVASYTADGQRDLSFGAGSGQVTYDFSESDSVGSMGLTRDGKIVLLHEKGNQFDNEYYLTRLLPDGRLDRGDGWATTNLSPGNDRINAIALQSDGKILAVGNSTGTQRLPVTSVVLYTANGRPDASFAGGGFTLGVNSLGRATTMDAQGRLLVVSQEAKATAPTDYDLTLRRFNPDGTAANFPAPIFSPTADLGSVNDSPNAIVVQPDGKIVLAATSSSKVVLLRYQTNGQPDPAFGNQGIVRTDFGHNTNVPLALALQPDGKIVVAGLTGTRSTNFDFGLARYLPNGDPDPAFGGGDGKVSTDFAGGQDQAHGLAIQPDGKLLLGGWATRDGRRQFALARYLPNGDPDLSFNGTGQALADFGVDAEAKALVLEPDGVIALAGCTQAQPNPFALARFRADGQPDTSLSRDGQATFVSPNGLGGCANALARDPASGDYLLAGQVTVAAGDTQFALARVKGRGRVNVPPVAAPNQYTTALNTPLTIAAPGVLGNDSAVEGQSLVAHLVTTTGNGALALESDGGFTYTPNQGFSGSDSFVYQAGDEVTLSESVSVTIAVSANPPTPNPNPNPGGFSVFLPLVVK